MQPDKTILLTSTNGVTLLRVTPPRIKRQKTCLASYIVESNRTLQAKAITTCTEALEYYEDEVDRCRLLNGDRE